MNFKINSERLLERFCRYVQVDTTANDRPTTYPSSPGQRELGARLLSELRAMGIAGAEQDQCGLVYATIPPAKGFENAPVIAFCAHVDTSPETTGKNVRPQIHRNYQGGDIQLPGAPELMIKVSENPELETLKGCCLVTSDGTTLLGADDKSGVAAIMEAAAFLMENRDTPRGPVRLLFTCDEEIGHGVDHVDLGKLGAVCCYTLDGSGRNEIDVETFSADLAIVKVRGVNIHPSIGKGRMVNAIRAASCFLDALPFHGLSPETTEDRQGFLHPYSFDGTVADATIRILLRDFDTEQLAEKAQLLKIAAMLAEATHKGAQIQIEIVPQYRNMEDGLKKEPRAVSLAVAAHKALGREPKLTIVRGGTDGSRLTELGLPTPNLSTGEHNPHSPREFACLEEMVAATEVICAIAAEWAKESGVR